MNLALNDTQRRLVEDNHNLIYSFLESRNLGMDEREDWYGVAAIALCKAAMTYNPDRECKFSSYAYTIMDNEVRRSMRNSRKNVPEYISLDEPVSEDMVVGDTIYDCTDHFGSIVFDEAVAQILKGWSDRDKLVVTSILYDDIPRKTIAKQVGLSTTSVGVIYNRFLEKIEPYLYD